MIAQESVHPPPDLQGLQNESRLTSLQWYALSSSALIDYERLNETVSDSGILSTIEKDIWNRVSQMTKFKRRKSSLVTDGLGLNKDRKSKTMSDLALRKKYYDPNDFVSLCSSTAKKIADL
ncbi:hypothetical protein vseg_003572 [Gypsophila vaccaria]